MNRTSTQRPTPDVPKTWAADCLDCSHGTLVMTFDRVDERNRWAREHRAAGHRVLEYLRPKAPLTSYPQRPA